MTTADVVAHPAARDDVPQLTGLLARAFADDPLVATLFPAADARRARRLLDVPRSQRLGGAWTTSDGSGAAVWFPSGSWKPSAWESMRTTPTAVRAFGMRLGLGAKVLAALQEHHPRQPHWHLYYLGAEPGRQSQGIGTALLRPVLQHCDQDGHAAYLEATSPRNQELYRRHGIADRAPIALPGGATAHPVWREPA